MKYKTYTQKEKELPPLTDNKIFQPVRNMIIKTVLDMNNPVVDIEIEEPEQSENDTDNITIDIPPLIDESEQAADDSVIFSDNNSLTAEDFTWKNENAVKVDIDDFSKSKYYLKWSKSYKEACKLIYNRQSKLEDFRKRNGSCCQNRIMFLQFMI